MVFLFVNCTLITQRYFNFLEYFPVDLRLHRIDEVDATETRITRHLRSWNETTD